MSESTHSTGHKAEPVAQEKTTLSQSDHAEPVTTVASKNETFRTVFTQFNDEALVVTSSFFTFFFLLFIAIWFYNRRKFQALGHQIPANVVQTYLDSIIQNSASLKSSLFRGGAQDLVPSILPIGGLGGGENVAVDPNKSAQIESLRLELTSKNALIKELEDKLSDVKPSASGADPAKLAALEQELKKTKDELNQAKSVAAASGGGSKELQGKVDELNERLKEYEVIEDDLANLKKLQQENEQLKKALEGKSGGAEAVAAMAAGAAVVSAAEAVAEETVPPVEEVASAETTEEVKEAPVVELSSADAALAPELGEEENKTGEDLLDEFEKMLGS